jgi:hypothetical protein
MFDPYAQMNPWYSGIFGTAQPYGLGSHQPFPFQSSSGFGWQSPYSGLQGQPPGFQGFSQFAQGGFAPQIAPQAWYGNPAGQPGPVSNPIVQQLIQQIPQLVQNAHHIAQQAPQLAQQLPHFIQQNPQLLQQAPQLQQVPQLLQQATLLAQQIPHVLQALCASPHSPGGAFGTGPSLGTAGGFRPFAYGQTVFS